MNASMSNATPTQLKAFKSQLESEYNQLVNQREAILTNESTLAKNRKQINATAVALKASKVTRCMMLQCVCKMLKI